MNKKMKSLLAEINQHMQMAKAFMADGESKDVAKAQAELDKAEALKAEYTVAEKLFKAEAKEVPDEGNVDIPDEKKSAVKAFITALRTKGKTIDKGLNVADDEEGGYTVPEDIVTKVKEFKQTDDNLEQYVNVEKVKTLKGARTYESRADITPFVDIDEGGAFTETDAPTFERVTYDVKKKGGFLPVTNELLKDSDDNIANRIAKWLGKKSVVTRNSMILTAVKSVESTAFTDINDIKKALNVDLDPAFKATAKIFTNQDGLQWLDTLTAVDGRPLLQPDVTNPTKWVLFGVPVVVISNSTWPSDTETEGKVGIPFSIGDWKELVTIFDREQISLKVSDVASVGSLNAFANDLTLFRALERLDCKKVDDKAVVNGVISVDALGE